MREWRGVHMCVEFEGILDLKRGLAESNMRQPCHPRGTKDFVKRQNASVVSCAWRDGILEVGKGD